MQSLVEEVEPGALNLVGPHVVGAASAGDGQYECAGHAGHACACVAEARSVLRCPDAKVPRGHDMGHPEKSLSIAALCVRRSSTAGSMYVPGPQAVNTTCCEGYT